MVFLVGCLKVRPTLLGSKFLFAPGWQGQVTQGVGWGGVGGEASAGCRFPLWPVTYLKSALVQAGLYFRTLSCGHPSSYIRLHVSHAAPAFPYNRAQGVAAEGMVICGATLRVTATTTCPAGAGPRGRLLKKSLLPLIPLSLLPVSEFLDLPHSLVTTDSRLSATWDTFRFRGLEGPLGDRQCSWSQRKKPQADQRKGRTREPSEFQLDFNQVGWADASGLSFLYLHSERIGRCLISFPKNGSEPVRACNHHPAPQGVFLGSHPCRQTPSQE